MQKRRAIAVKVEEKLRKKETGGKVGINIQKESMIQNTNSKMIMKRHKTLIVNVLNSYIFQHNCTM